ncbi:MAG: acyltransferase family protein, partial [Gammaproteobacteria bacterium]
MYWISRQFELSRHGAAPNLRPMEGMRGFAVFLVFLVHYATLAAPWVGKDTAFDQVLHTVHTIGNAGVDLFFVLSGYLIYGSLIARAQRFLPFIRRRIARIYPAFCVVFALYLLLSFAYPAESKLPKAGIDAWLYLCQNFLLLPGVLRIEPMITAAWSLSYEMLYYLVIPVVIAMLRLRARSRAFRVAFFCASAVGLAAYCALYDGHVRFLMFIAGSLLYEALQDRSIAVPRSPFTLLALVGGLVATTLPYAGSAATVSKQLLLCWSFGIVCYACFRQPDNAVARAFSHTGLRWLGNMSYSYYLLHGLTLKAGFKVLFAVIPHVQHEVLAVLATLPLMFAFTLATSAVLFIFVEKPLSLAVPVPGHVPAAAPLASTVQAS